ncbi:hypothetical protein ACFL0C_02390 [Patescibacteria group bacterium]
MCSKGIDVRDQNASIDFEESIMTSSKPINMSNQINDIRNIMSTNNNFLLLNKATNNAATRSRYITG